MRVSVPATETQRQDGDGATEAARSVVGHRGTESPREVVTFLRVSVPLWLTTFCVSLYVSVALAGCRRSEPPAPPPLVPQVSGSIVVEGLSGPVRVVRDTWGVPHIYATRQDDLFVAQGFIQAQDRLFQMDLWRRTAQGRLAEVLGANFIGRDAMTRRIQYEGNMDAEWVSYGPDAKAIATSFVRGINAWVALARERPPEEFVLAGWRPELWSPEDLLARTDAFLTSDGALTDVFRAQLAAAVGADRAAALLMMRETRAASLVPRGIDLSVVNFALADAIRQIGTRPFFIGLGGPVGLVGPGGAVAATNAWAVAPRRSTTGKPLLANDPHRPFDDPSPFYLVHLNAPGWNVAGATPAWLPGVALGHNDRVAWGMAAFDADVQDLYVERLNPDDRHQVEDGGRWVNTRVVGDQLWVKGRSAPTAFEREYTRHGVVVATDPERHLAFTLRWSGSEPGAAAGLAATAIDRVASWPEFRTALARWNAPVSEAVYADVDGNTGSQVAGLVPARRGWDGDLPAPGWTTAYEWDGWRTVDEMPHAFNPVDGRVISANANRSRVNRLGELLKGAGAFSVEDFKRFQRDVLAWNATMLVPLLARVHADRADVEQVRQRLLAWDKRLSAESADAMVYVAWERALERLLVRQRIEPALAGEFDARAGSVLVPALTRPSRVWFDGDVLASRNTLLLNALAAAFDDVQKQTASLAGDVSWGRLHQATFEHPFGINPPARRRFNVGPFGMPGYGDTVMSTGGMAFEASRGASFSAIYDASDWDRTVVLNAPGQSGSPASPHFRDLAKLWAEGSYFQLAFSDAAVQAVTESTLTLEPRR